MTSFCKITKINLLRNHLQIQVRTYSWSWGLLEVERVEEVESGRPLCQLIGADQELLDHPERAFGELPKLAIQSAATENLKKQFKNLNIYMSIKSQ
jgi:hypothetical protein